MPEHNGDYSPEAEYKRKMKREKVQRSRIRKKIDAGRATALEIAALDAWDKGADWLLEELAQEAQVSKPRAPRARKPAQEVEEEEEVQTTRPAWQTWAEIGGFIAACIVLGALGIRKVNE